MVAHTTKIRVWTYDDYAQLRDDAPTYVRYEIVAGEIFYPRGFSGLEIALKEIFS